LLTAVPLLIVAFGLILFSSELFTNGVEWIGVRLGLGHGAVGSVLAAVGTAMPETVIPIIAILFVGSSDAQDVGVGAILGAPFLLSTAALAVAGTGLVLYGGRRQHASYLQLSAHHIRRDLEFFSVAFGACVLSSFLPWKEAQYVVAAGMLSSYALYVFKAVTQSGEPDDEALLNPLRLTRYIGRPGPPPTLLAWFQAALALAGIVAGAYLFVHEIERVSLTLGLPALALSLLVTPLATELPETFNSVIWIREGKDTLALGNITGAMVLQSSIPAAVGVVFTDWELTDTALVSAALTFISVGTLYYAVRRQGHLEAIQLLRPGVLWVGFVIYVALRLSL
jgi:cation:H+ antiporter